MSGKDLIRALLPPAPSEKEEDDLGYALMERLQFLSLRNKVELLNTALPFVETAEKKRRMKIMGEMFVHVAYLEQEQKIFGLSLVMQGIEAIIAGDWKECRQIAEWLENKQEDESIRAFVEEHHRILITLLRKAAAPTDLS